MRYCPDCGGAVVQREIEGRLRAYCPRCEKVFYEQLKVGAGCLIEERGRLLLVQRARAPFRGDWNLPAGYVEADEEPAHAAMRETLEETGLEVEAEALAGVYYFDDDPRGSGILIVYRCRIVGGLLRHTEEGSRNAWFPAWSLPAGIAGGGHERAIRAWAKEKLAAVEEGRAASD